jgi:peptidoglycan-associated lipoprotein
MRRLILVAITPLVLGAAAHAQTKVLCATFQARLTQLSAAGNVPALNAALKTRPPGCSVSLSTRAPDEHMSKSSGATPQGPRSQVRRRASTDALQQAPAPSASAPSSTGSLAQQQRAGPTPGSAQDFAVSAGNAIYFSYDSYALGADAKRMLGSQAAWLRDHPAAHVRVEGGSDQRGSREYNLALAYRRANVVRDYLVAQGIAADRVEAISYGKERPMDAGAGGDALAHNRSVHLVIVQGSE